MSRAIAQLPLPLAMPNGWGGLRCGAGRKPSGPRRMPHLRRGTITRHAPCHITLRVRRGIPSLRSVRLVRALERSFSQACERGAFRLAHYSLQADHVHLVVEADDAAALGRGMSSIAARLARAVNRVFGRRGRVFADRFHHRVLRTPREVRNVLAYVLNNARKHVPGVARPGVRIETATGGIDPASSGRWFPGWRNGPAPPTDTLAPIARPRSWLLSKGWLRHGRIDPAEVPGGRKRGPGRRPAGSGASC